MRRLAAATFSACDTFAASAAAAVTVLSATFPRVAKPVLGALLGRALSPASLPPENVGRRLPSDTDPPPKVTRTFGRPPPSDPPAVGFGVGRTDGGVGSAREAET